MKLSKSKSLHKPKNKRKRFGKNKSYRIIKLKNKKKNSFKKNKHLNLKNKSFRKKRKYKQKGGSEGTEPQSEQQDNDIDSKDDNLIDNLEQSINEMNSIFSDVSPISKYLYTGEGDIGFVHNITVGEDMYAVLFNADFYTDYLNPKLDNQVHLKQQIRNNPFDLFLYKGNASDAKYNLGYIDKQDNVIPIQGHNQSTQAETKTLNDINIHPNIFILMGEIDKDIETHLLLNNDLDTNKAFKKINFDITFDKFQVSTPPNEDIIELSLSQLIPVEDGQTYNDIFKMTFFYHSYLKHKIANKDLLITKNNTFLNKFTGENDTISLKELFGDIPFLVSHQNNNHYPYPFEKETNVRYQVPYQIKNAELGQYFEDEKFFHLSNIFPIIQNAEHMLFMSDDKSKTVSETKDVKSQVTPKGVNVEVQTQKVAVGTSSVAVGTQAGPEAATDSPSGSNTLLDRFNRFKKYTFTENSDEIETGTSITVYSSGNSDGNLTIHVSNKTKALEQLEIYKAALKEQKDKRKELEKIKEETEKVKKRK